MKLELDPVDPDQVGCALDASGTAVLWANSNNLTVAKMIEDG